MGIKNLSVQGVLDNEECVIPSEAAACEFAGIIEKLHNLIFSNGMQCKKLAETRDALLPKLMSGEMEVG